MDDSRRTMRWAVLLLSIAALAIFVQMWAPLVFAAWFAALADPLICKIKFLGGRRRAAGALIVVLFLLLLLPLAIVVISATGGVLEAIEAVRKSKGALAAMQALIDGSSSGGSPPGPWTAARVMTMVRSYGERAFDLLSMVAGAATHAVIGVFVFATGAYAMIAHGRRAREWLYAHAPLSRSHAERFGAAFVETGRGLLIGGGLTAVAQAALATITYLALGIPRALVLGLVTFFAGLIPTIGTGLVWVPVAVGLAISGRTVAAIAMAVVGVVVISSVDNVLRPALSKWGHLNLPTFVVMVSMFGGLALLGTWGLVLGPLLVRLAVEGLNIAREENLFRSSGPAPRLPPAEPPSCPAPAKAPGQPL